MWTVNVSPKQGLLGKLLSGQIRALAKTCEMPGQKRAWVLTAEVHEVVGPGYSTCVHAAGKDVVENSLHGG
jgi:hypothetical protein